MFRISVTALFVLGSLDFATADEPLHTRIDQLIEQQADGIELAGRSDGAEFHRRVWLDLAGRIPTAAETRAFLSDASTGKRQRLIDERLESPEYARRMSELFHAVLMERRNVNDEWTRFLRTAFERNLAWDQMAQALIRADAEDADLRGAAFFLTARLTKEGAMAPVDIPGLTRDVGRLLAGVDLQCAQCHNHLTISDYEQQHFQGLHMIFENMQTRRDVKFPAVSEKLMTQKKEYLSVFDQIPMQTALTIPGGSEVDIVVFEKGEKYARAPDTKTRTPGIPKFSPLGELASGLATANNELFCRNIANRLWFVMMGRGLFEPLDLQHSSNPPTHPELLDLLAHEFAEHEFNIRWFLRELALTETYQRTSQVEPDQTAPPVESYAVGLEKRLNAEQLFWSMLVATDELTYQASKPAQPPAPVTTEETEAKAEEPEEPPREPLKLTDIEQVQAGSQELTELRDLFLAAYANAAKEPEIEFNPSVKAALFLMHEEKVLALLEPRTGNLVDRLSGIDDSSAIADELFTAILGRPPSDEDRKTVTDFLNKHTDHRTDAINQLAWAMLASTEFCVNH